LREKDKFRGCLIGGAAGDALGYAVEFMRIDQIRRKYGDNGIISYKLKDGVAEISDDTQMTLFTANGLLIRTTRGMLRGIAAGAEGYCWRCYEAWLVTQNADYETWKNGVKDINHEFPWLIRIPGLHKRRAPGNTVLGALHNGNSGTIDKPINDSKGCGGVMRVAPIGLYFEGNDAIDEIVMFGADNAALTHGHDLGYIPAAALVYLINRIIYSKTFKTLEEIAKDCIQKINLLFADKPHIGEFNAIMNKAIELAKADRFDVDAITEIGEGWVAEEALAIALYCSLKYNDNFEKAIIASVNHSGDSDSTGSITGNIIGAIHGYKNIPERFINNLELKDLILEVADDLFRDCQVHEYQEEPWTDEDEKWFNKYAC